MLSLPGSHNQPLHQDGPHLTPSHKPLDKGDDDLVPPKAQHLTAHALNIFIPLVDLTAANGATEFYPTTHILRQYSRTDGPAQPVVPLAKAGDAVIFDYRVKHRGLANNSQSPRPVIYVTFAKPWFRDDANFSARRYRKLPPAVYEDDSTETNRNPGSSPPPEDAAGEAPIEVQGTANAAAEEGMDQSE